MRPQLAQVVEHRLQEIGRYDHVDMFVLAAALALKLKRSDADQLAPLRDQSGATPVGMRGVSEQRLIQQIFPIAGKLLLGGDLARDRPGAPAGAAQHDFIADAGGSRRAERQRGNVEAAKRLNQPKAGFEIKAESVTLHHAAIIEVQPHRFGLRDQVADRQHQSVVDHDPVAGPLGAEIIGAESIGRNDGMQPTTEESTRSRSKL